MVRFVDMSEALDKPCFALYDTVSDSFISDSFNSFVWDSREDLWEGLEDKTFYDRVEKLLPESIPVFRNY